MNEIYLVTGAAGHLGSTVIRELLKLGKSIRALVIPGEKNTPGRYRNFYGDVRNPESMYSFLITLTIKN